jgi:hypothetical protein
VARDQIRDQIADQQRLSRPVPCQTERRIEIHGTYCNGSGHLGRGRRVETQRSHLGPVSQVSECHPQVVGKIGADGVIVLSSCSQVRDGGHKASCRGISRLRHSGVGHGVAGLENWVMTPPATLFLIVGLPGAGKTTRARELEKAYRAYGSARTNG